MFNKSSSINKNDQNQQTLKGAINNKCCKTKSTLI